MLLRGKSTQKIHLRKPPLISKKFFLIRLHSSTFVFTRLHSSRLFCDRLDLSGDLSTLVYIRLDLSSDSSTLVYIRLHLFRPIQTHLVTRLCFKNRLFCEEYFSSMFKIFCYLLVKRKRANVQVNSPKSLETSEIKSVTKYVKKRRNRFYFFQPFFIYFFISLFQFLKFLSFSEIYCFCFSAFWIVLVFRNFYS